MFREVWYILLTFIGVARSWRFVITRSMCLNFDWSTQSIICVQNMSIYFFQSQDITIFFIKYINTLESSLHTTSTIGTWTFDTVIFMPPNHYLHNVICGCLLLLLYDSDNTPSPCFKRVHTSIPVINIDTRGTRGFSFSLVSNLTKQ